MRLKSWEDLRRNSKDRWYEIDARSLEDENKNLLLVLDKICM